MRVLALFAAFALVAAPLVSAPSVAYADGIERPRRPRATPRPAPAPAPALTRGAPEQPVVESNLVTLPASFFAGSSGGVGADIGGGGYSSVTVIVRGGGGGSAFAFASASAGAGARVGGRFGGRGGGGCSCH